MIATILDALPLIAASMLLGVWVVHILRMWLSLTKRDE